MSGTLETRVEKLEQRAGVGGTIIDDIIVNAAYGLAEDGETDAQATARYQAETGLTGFYVEAFPPDGRRIVLREAMRITLEPMIRRRSGGEA
jgi:hypothetical protein